MKTLTKNEDNDLCLSLLFGRLQSHDRYDYVSTVVYMRCICEDIDVMLQVRVYREYYIM